MPIEAIVLFGFIRTLDFRRLLWQIVKLIGRVHGQGEEMDPSEIPTSGEQSQVLHRARLNKSIV